MDEIDIQLVHGKDWFILQNTPQFALQFPISTYEVKKRAPRKLKSEINLCHETKHFIQNVPTIPGDQTGTVGYGGPFIFNYQKKYRNDMY